MALCEEKESYKTIPLTQGQVAIVDAKDYEWLSRYKWCATWQKDRFYAMRAGPRIKGRTRRPIFMHREIMGLGRDDPRFVDHKEPSATLDNRRSNLRIANNSLNQCNRRARRGTITGVKGVSFDRDRNKLEVKIRINGKQVRIGRWNPNQLSEAAAAYRAAATEHYGEFARFE